MKTFKDNTSYKYGIDVENSFDIINKLEKEVKKLKIENDSLYKERYAQNTNNNIDKITLLTKIEELNETIRNCHSIIQFNRHLCKHLSIQSNASQLYLIDKNVKDGFVNIRNYMFDKNKKNSTEQALTNINTKEHKKLSELSNNEGISVLTENNTIIIIPEEDNFIYQLIITIKINQYKSIHIIFNYIEEIYLSDNEYSTYIYPQIKSTYEKLDIFEQLIENEAKFRALTENLTDVILIQNKNEKYTYVSPSVKLYGFKTSDILNKSRIDFVSPDDIPTLNNALNNVSKEPGKSITLNSIRINWNNKQFVVDMSLTNLLHVKGVNGIVINIQDNTDKIEVLKQVYESEEKYRSLLENANDGICLLNIHKIVFANNKLSQMLNIENDNLIGSIPSNLAPKNQPDGIPTKNKIREIIRQTLNGQTLNFEFRFKRSDDSEFDGLVSISKVELFDGTFSMAIIRDISDIKEAHRSIEESEARLSNIFESMSDAVYLCSNDFKIEYANKALKEQVNSNLVGKTCYNEIYGLSKPCKYCNNKDLKENESKILNTYNKKNNKHYQVSKTLIINNKKKKSYLHISRDITQIINAQEKIRYNEEKFRTIFNNSIDAIYITSLNGNFLEVNNKLIERDGYNRDYYLKKDIYNYIESTDTPIKDYVDKIKKNGSAICDFTHKNRSGDSIYIEISGKIIEYLGQKAILHISRDISIRKKLEREILDSTIKTEEKERKRFARDLHDGIGPYLSATKLFLNTISIEDDVIEREYILNKAKTSIDEIISSIKEISNNISPHVLENFGLVAALNSFKKKTTRSNVEINIISNIGSERLSENIEISLFRIIIELINNTFKYGKASIIEVSLLKTENNLMLNFAHNGSGFNYNEIISKGKGMGLFNIINRVNSLNGTSQFITNEKSNFNFKASFTI